MNDSYNIKIAIIALLTCSTALYSKTFASTDVSYEKEEALWLINEKREAVGLNPLLDNKRLQKAAQNHATYLTAHKSASHFEQEGDNGFTGTTPQDRAVKVGYASRYVKENLSARNVDAKDSIQGLFSAVYHRLTFLDPILDEIGVGVALDNSLDTKHHIFVYDMGSKAMVSLCLQRHDTPGRRFVGGLCADRTQMIPETLFLKTKEALLKQNPKMTVYPYAGQMNVPPAFYDEDPDPLPDMDVSGFPISVGFNPYYVKKVTLKSFVVYDESGKALQTRLMTSENDPHGRLDRFHFVLFPIQRLEYHSRYRVVFNADVDGKDVRYEWQFDTIKPEEKLYRVAKDDTSLYFQGKKSAWIYFVPHDAHDLLGEINYDSRLGVYYIDGHTLRVVLPENIDDTFVLKVSGRKVTIKP